MTNQDKLNAIRTVLLESWDPIGVRYEQAAQDEYDAYLPEILHMLEREASVADIARHLRDIAELRMGLIDVADRDRTAAAQLARLTLR